MDIGKSFTFIFDDEEWVSKLLIGALFVLASTVSSGHPVLAGICDTTRAQRDGRQSRNLCQDGMIWVICSKKD